MLIIPSKAHSEEYSEEAVPRELLILYTPRRSPRMLFHLWHILEVVHDTPRFARTDAKMPEHGNKPIDRLKVLKRHEDDLPGMRRRRRNW